MGLDLGLGWMAWTWPTAAFFVFIGICIATMAVWEWRSPGGAPRRGIFSIDTTRGDRLFISLLGSAFIFLAWIGLVGTLLWWPLAIAVGFAVLVFLFV